MLRYLHQHRQIDPTQMTKHDRSGTLSHWLLLRLAFFEEALGQKNQKLPFLTISRPTQPNLPELTDAEAITAFSQLQRRRIEHEKAVGASRKRNLGEISNSESVTKEGQADNTKRRRSQPRVNFYEVSSNSQNFEQTTDTVTREEGDFKVQLEPSDTPSMRARIVQPSTPNSGKRGSCSKEGMPLI